jgi:hypothetical protein
MNATPPTSSSAPKRRWLPRFGLRTLLVVMGVLGIGLAYFGNLLHRAQHQRQVVAKIKAAGGEVEYNWQFGMGVDLDSILECGYHPYSTSYDETSDGRRQRTRITPAGKIVEVETPPGPWAIRKMLGDDVFAHVESVSFFDFKFQRAGQLDPQLLLELPQLKVAQLTYGQVNDDWLGCVAQVPHLRMLSLMGYTEGTASKDGLARLHSAKQLEYVGITGEWADDETVAGLAQLRQLKSLQLIEVPNVSSAVFANLHDLTELRELVIFRAKQIDDRGAETLSRLYNLRELQLLDTPISDTTLVHVAGLTQLEYLDLSATNVGDPGMEYLANLPNLKYLALRGTKVADAGLPAIARLAQLEMLHLSSTLITDSGLLHLHSLKNLRELWIGPHVTQAGADELRKALPQCKVRRFDASGRGLD